MCCEDKHSSKRPVSVPNGPKILCFCYHANRLEEVDEDEEEKDQPRMNSEVQYQR